MYLLISLECQRLIQPLHKHLSWVFHKFFSVFKIFINQNGGVNIKFMEYLKRKILFIDNVGGGET